MRSGAFSFACHDVVVMHQPALEREDCECVVARLGLLSGWCRCSLLVTRREDDPARGCLSSDLSGRRDRCRPGARLLA
jgi:hypothetical protein